MSLSDVIYNIRHAISAKKVRESIASAFEEVSNKEDKNRELYENMVIGAGESNSEIVDARLDNTTGKRYEKIGKRLDDFSSQINESSNTINARIDEYLKGQNENTDNAETRDIRVGVNGVTYKSAGTAVRTQISDIKDIIVPSYYPDFVKKASETSVTDKEITATFDSIKIVEKVDNNTQNHGFSIEIKQDVKKIKFDIDYQGFGVNCGLYYFADTTLKAQYKTISRDVSEELKTEAGLEFELDWDVINAKFNTLGANKIVLIFWNVAGSKINGYNYIYNIKINDFMKLQNVCEKLLDLKEYTDESASNILFGSVKNKDTILAETKNLTRWGTTINSTVTITDNTVTIDYTSSTGNTGAITNNNFTPSSSNFIKISGNLTSFTTITDGAKVSITLVGKSTQDGSLVYKNISKGAVALGEFSYVVDLNYYGVYTDLDITQPLNVLIGTENGGSKSTIENFQVVSNDLMQCSELVGDTLTETTKNFDTSINSIENRLAVAENDKLVSPSGKKYVMQVNDDGSFSAVPIIPSKTLIIGNSLLKGFGLTLDDGSKNIFGMCATSNEADYFYHLSQYIKNLNPDATLDKLAGDIEQAETQATVDTWISNNITGKISDYDLVIVQLGDNVNNAIRIELFKTWCKQLLKAIRVNAQKARVVWVGEWYTNAEREKIMAQSCIDTGCEFINITDIHSSKDSEATLDTVIIKDKANNITFLVSDYPNSTGVATHPNDASHEKIALRIIEKLF